MNRLAFFLLAFFTSGGAFAIGLGDLNKQPVLGERLQIEVGITGAGKDGLDASCYRLKQPASGDEIPWVRTATMSVRKGASPVLEIRSGLVVQEPILAVSVHIACGHEIVRDYVLLASPAKEAASPDVLSGVQKYASNRSLVSAQEQEVAQRSVSPKRPPRAVDAENDPPPRKNKSRPAASHVSSSARGMATDRLMISSGGEVGEPSLRISSHIASLNERDAVMNENQREVIRLEYRMLLALQEQALTQLAAAEKLRSLDKAVLELQQVNTNSEPKSVVPAVAAPAPTPPPVVVPPVPVQPVMASAAEEDSLLEEWGLYALVFLLVAGLAGWLGWREYQDRRARELLKSEFIVLEPQDIDVDENVEPAPVVSEPVAAKDVSAPPVEENVSFGVNLDDAESPHVDISLAQIPLEPTPFDNGLESATVDERFEANPVMELADIMLSFGRVKGAAQALQEYIDANPQEALQPWMRLLDVYRMAGMRAEFEDLALNLNKNFNVEIQHWEKPSAPAGDDHSIDFVLDEVQVEPVLPPHAEHIEDLPRIMQQVIERWTEANFDAFIYELLRDNRGGARAGFSLGVVQEMLFLIELKETLLSMEKEASTA